MKPTMKPKTHAQLGRKRIEDRTVIKSINKTICMTEVTFNGLVELANRLDMPPATLGRKIIEAKVKESLG